MSERDEIELSEAFRELSAPRSTADYQRRAPSVEVQGGGTRWPQALASVLAVVVALAGAGTFLALRNARQNGVATTGAGNPPARSGAAMAYDSAAGLTVMFGGTGVANTPLHDTWVWDGSSWKAPALAGGPGPLASVHMSDDPTDGGVLLTGMPELPGAVSGTAGGVTGCVTGVTGTGSASAGSGTAGPGSPGVATGQPAATRTPGAILPTLGAAPASTAPATAPSPCAALVIPSVQTWVFGTQGWHRVDAAAGAIMPAANSQLAYDAASGDVLAVATSVFACGLPLNGGSAQPQVACELPAASGAPSSAGGGGSASSGSAQPRVCTVTECPIRTVPCPLAASIYSCNGGGSVATWVWSGGRWRAAPALNSGVVEAVPVSGAAGQRALLVGQSWGPYPCQGPVAACAAITAHPPATPTVVTWRWTGSGWDPRSAGDGPTLAGAAVASVDGRVVVVAADGSTKLFDLNSDKFTSTGSVPPRSGEAVAQGPGGTLMLFGGFAYRTVGSATVMFGTRPGADTWRWDGRAWTHLSGAQPVTEPLPTLCSSSATDTKGCAVPPAPPMILPAPSGSASAVPGSTGPSPSPTPTG